MTECPDCHARVPAGAAWCGQCYRALAPVATAAAPVPAPAGAPTPPAAGSRFLWDGQPQPVVVPVQTPPVEDLLPAGAPVSSGRGSAGRAVLIAIGMGALLQGLFLLLDRDHAIEPEAMVRYSIVATLALYAGVFALVLNRISRGGVRLHWTDGNPLAGVALGLATGGGLAGLLLLAGRAATGHLSTDPRAVLLVSEGDAAHIAATVLIMVIAAPAVEEILFRGLFAESLRGRGAATAIWLSALAFAAWHLNPGALRYYALMGALLGRLYWRRGLSCSMAAHVAFNGTLTAIAVAIALTPGHTVSTVGLTLEAPRGWSTAATHVGRPSDIALEGPSAAEVFVHEDDLAGRTVSAEDLLARVAGNRLDAVLPGFVIQHDTARLEDLPAGRIVRVSVTAQGHAGELVLLPEPGRIYTIAFGSGGSAKARHDFDRMLQSVRVS